jgi:hypothetical protein
MGDESNENVIEFSEKYLWVTLLDKLLKDHITE